jgi:alpha-L-fucosidase 2
LTDLIEHLAIDGVRAAAAYGCRGWTAHHNTDIWAQANAVKGKAVWFLWPYAAAWLSLHVYEEYLFSNDNAFARERALPLMRGAAEFLLDWLQTQPDGTLQSSPSTSPENPFVAADGQPCGVSIGSESDIAMTRALWLACLDVAERLALDEPWLAEIRAALTCAELSNRTKPLAIIAHTVKGRGVSFMEDDNNWHYRIPNAEEFTAARKELGVV